MTNSKGPAVTGMEPRGTPSIRPDRLGKYAEANKGQDGAMPSAISCNVNEVTDAKGEMQNGSRETQRPISSSAYLISGSHG